MGQWVTATGVAVAVFAATNIDDILLLSAFFADRTLRSRAVVAGQFAGIGVLTTASALAAALALTIPDGWVALLGLVPLSLGIRSLYSWWQSRHADDAGGDDEIRAAEERAHSASHSQWIAVALVTIANGGDNLGVYIPLFSRELSAVPLYASIFAVMTAVWCAAGYWLVHHPVLGARIRQYGHVVLPFVLIGLGLHILKDALVLLH